MTYEELKKANESLKTIEFKGKGYAQVNERVKAFRMICPNGTISTEIVDLTDGVVTMKASIYNDEGIIATGYAQEKESSSYINKTSFIENCETSAVGRALGFAGIGIDGSMASADELANALNNQAKETTKPEYISKKEQAILTSMIQKRGLNVENVLNGTPLEKVTPAMFADATKRLSKLPEVAQ